MGLSDVVGPAQLSRQDAVTGVRDGFGTNVHLLLPFAVKHKPTGAQGPDRALSRIRNSFTAAASGRRLMRGAFKDASVSVGFSSYRKRLASPSYA